LSRIDINVVATGNFSTIEAQIAKLKADIAGLSAAGLAVNPQATRSMQTYISTFSDALNASGNFTTKMVNLTSETERFGRSLERGNLRLGQYFRTATQHIRSQQGEISKLAKENVRLMNSRTLALGDGRAMVITPTGIDEAIHKQQILNQEYRIFRQVVAGGSTQLINWGKNTQWAGRQLTVGLTVPLTIFGAAAGKVFMDADKQLTRLAKVYGDASKGMTDQSELQAIRQETLGLAKEIASTMGVAVTETLGLAADIAATGKQGNELLAATNEAVRLSVLGEVDRQEAMKTTLAIQTVFKKDTQGLADSINFLNAVENQTSTSLNDLSTAIVKAGPVVQGLGGSVEDLALMLVAMREGGVPASEAANAIKSSLGALINPTKQTTEVLSKFGININEIVNKNAGNVIGTLTDLQSALEGLDSLSRQRAIEQLFGKFQFSRINALLSNLNKAGSQTEQVLALAGMSAADLAANADKELKVLTESTTVRFQRAVETLKANLIPIGEVFVTIATVLINVGNKILDVFNNLPEPIQALLKGLGYLTAFAGPLIMITGVLGNFFGYLIKGISFFMGIKRAGRGIFQHITEETIAAESATLSLTDSAFKEEEAFKQLAAAIDMLNAKLEQLALNLREAAGAGQGIATMANAEASALAGAGGMYGEQRFRFTGEGGKTSGISKPHYYSAAKFLAATRETGAPTEFAGLTDAQIKGGLRSQHMIAPGGEYGLIQSQLGKQTAIYSNEQERQDFLSQITGIIGKGGYTVDPQAALKAVVASREDFIKRQAEFRARLEGLAELPSDVLTRLSASLNEASKSGGDVAAQAERIVSQAIAEDKAATRKYAQTRAETIDHLSSMQNLGTEDFAKEAALYTGSKEVSARGKLTAKGMTADITASLDGAVQVSMVQLGSQFAADSELMLRTATEEAIGQSRDTFISQGKKSGRKLIQFVDTSGTKFIADITNGLENAIVYRLDESGRVIESALSKSAAKKKMSTSRAQTAVAKFHAAEDRLDAMVAADIEAAALAQQNAAAGIDNPNAGKGGIRGRLAGRGAGVAMGLGSVASMATMFAPTGDNQALNTGLNILGGAGLGISMGAMAGPPGMIVGGILGAIIPSVSAMAEATQKTYDEARARIEAIRSQFGRLSEQEQNLLGVDIKSMSEMTFNALNNKTQEAASAVDEFAQSIRDAAAGTAEYNKAQTFRNATSAEDIMSSGAFRLLVGSALATGADQSGVRNILEAYMKATDKQVYAAEVFAGAEESMSRGLEGFIQSERDRVSGANKELLAGFKQYMPATYGELSPIQAGKDFAQASRSFEQFVSQGLKIEGMDITSLAAGIIDPNFISQLSRNATGADAGFAGPQIYQIQLNGQDISAEQSQAILDSISPITQGVTAGSNIKMINPAIKQNLDLLQTYREEVSVVGKVIADAFATQPLEDFEDSILPIVEMLGLTRDEMQQFRSELPQDGREVFDQIFASTQSMTAAMAAARLAVAEVGYDIDKLRGKTAGEILLIVRQVIVTEQIQQGLADVTSSAEFSGKTREQRLQDTGSGSGGGGSADTSGIEDTYDRQIEKQDELIERIRKEREERQKLFDLEKQAFDFAMQEQDLKNQIARARAEGNTAEAAMLQSRLDNARATNKEQENERRRQEIEDRKIEAAEKRKEALQKAKEIATKDAQGGGGGGGSSAEKTAKEVTYLTRQAIDGVLKEVAEENIFLTPEEFLQSEQIQKMMKQLRDGYGATVEEAQAYAMNFYNASNQMVLSAVTDLDAIRDRFTQQFSLYEEFTNLPDEQKAQIQSNLEFIMFNPVLSRGEKIDQAVELFRNLGMGPKEAADAAKESYDVIKGLYGRNGAQTVVNEFRDEWSKIKDQFDPETAKTVSTLFLEGIKEGSTKPEILNAISAEIYKSTYTDGIEKGLNPTVAAALAQGMADEVKTTTSNALKNFNVQVPFVATYDDGVLPDFLKKTMAGGLGSANKGMRAMGFDVSHRWEGDLEVTADLGTLGTVDNPMWVKMSGGAANGGLIARGTGGMIYGPGGPTADIIPTMLSNGEYVIRASSVKKYGIPFLDMINKGMLPAMAAGGYSRYPSMVARMGGGGYAYHGMSSGGLANESSAEYNINVNVSGTNASPEEIASVVMQTLQRREKMNRAGIRI
jgi:TP901 family phage tail tape measure protein